MIDDASTAIEAMLREEARAFLAEHPDGFRTFVALNAPHGKDMVPDETAMRIAADYGISAEAIEAVRADLEGRSGDAIATVVIGHGSIETYEQPIPRLDS